MRKNLLRTILLISVISFTASTFIFAQSSEEFKMRIESIRDKMEPNSIMILRGNTTSGEESFRQDNNFYYLTGINEPGASMIIFSDPGQSSGRPGMRRISNFYPVVLFVTPRDSSLIDWIALPPGIEGTKEKLGFADVRASSEFQDNLDRQLLRSPSVVYIDYIKSRRLRDPLTDDENLFKLARDKGADFKLWGASDIINPMRRIKSESEIEKLRMAIEITALAHKTAMRAAESGMYEYQLQSIIEHVFTINGAVRPGFSSIVGSGKNSCILHWIENTKLMEPGDLVVIDIGAEYQMYTADITRTIPVNGKFTKRQKDIYEIVLRANETAISMLAPGVNWRDVSSKASEALAEGLMKLGMINDRTELRKYYFHGLGHPIGLNVHDVGGAGTLEPGMIITIEPGIYDRENGEGVRIEDDVLITQTGYEVLSKNAPKTVAEVEKLMSEKGLDFKKYIIRK